MSNSVESPEPSVFTLIINGEIPGRFVWRDPEVVAFMTIAPLRPGHTLVVPVRQVDHWTDLDPELWLKVCEVQQIVGQAIMNAYSPRRVGAIIAGMEVPHCHIHLVPIEFEAQLSFANIDHSPDPADLDAAAEKIRGELRKLGRAEVTDG